MKSMYLGYIRSYRWKKQFGNYQYVEPPALKKIWDVNHTVLISFPVRVPDKDIDMYSFLSGISKSKGSSRQLR